MKWRAERGGAAASLACAVALVLLAVRAFADEPRVALAWSAPVACPDEASVRASVAQLLAGSSAAVVEGRAEVRRSGERWQVVVTMNGGERRLEADSCRALADATALIVAMAVDPARVAANRGARDTDAGTGLPDAAPPLPDAAPLAPPGSIPDAAAPDAAATLSPLVPPPLSSPPPPTPAPASASSATSIARRTWVAVSAGETVDFGTLPTTAFGPSLGVAWTPWPLRLELAVAYFPSASATVPPGSPFQGAAPPGASVQFSLLSAALRGCYQATLASFDLGPCAGFEAGFLRASPQGFDSTSSATNSGLFALEGGLLGAWRVFPALALVARADALLQTNSPAFQVNAATLHQVGLVTSRGSLGVELRF